MAGQLSTGHVVMVTHFGTWVLTGQEMVKMVGSTPHLVCRLGFMGADIGAKNIKECTALHLAL
jgi:hypothetical protein